MFLIISSSPHLYLVHLIILLTLAFFRRRKETTSTEDERVLVADISKQRELVLILVMQ
jgi:hypothetical protein